MTHNPKCLFLASTGMITPLGANTAMTAAAVKAGVSAYTLSDYYNRNFQPIKVAAIPPALFDGQDMDANDWTGSHASRVAFIASLAVEQACIGIPPVTPFPLIMAMPEATGLHRSTTDASLASYLANSFPHWINFELSRSIYSGRAAGIDALAFVFDYLYDLQSDFILVGGSDSQLEDFRLAELDKADRLITPETSNGFVPGEGAAFLLLTRNPEHAITVNGHRIVLYPPGVDDEPGHLHSDQPYRGDGLDRAFKKALANAPSQPIKSIYSSMNGEHYWAKEYGVAYMRNRQHFVDPVGIEHPADCYGDIGSATVPALIALAAQQLLVSSTAHAHLIYSSSDCSRRGAIILKKVAVN